MGRSGLRFSTSVTPERKAPDRKAPGSDLSLIAKKFSYQVARVTLFLALFAVGRDNTGQQRVPDVAATNEFRAPMWAEQMGGLGP